MAMTNANSGGGALTNMVPVLRSESIYTLSAGCFRYSGPDTYANSELFRPRRYPLISLHLARLKIWQDAWISLTSSAVRKSSHGTVALFSPWALKSCAKWSASEILLTLPFLVLRIS